ncbi:hypothetical protein L1887_05168 [Cichorium endivia]|nr:hypothetical protein L1887_05168 [Cichorium endivia]
MEIPASRSKTMSNVSKSTRSATADLLNGIEDLNKDLQVKVKKIELAESKLLTGEGVDIGAVRSTQHGEKNNGDQEKSEDAGVKKEREDVAP